MSTSKRAKGFTLIELLITIAIIGILTAIAIPQFNTYRNNSFNTMATTDLKVIMSAEELYYVSNHSYVNLSTIAGYQASLPSLPGIRLSTNICAKVTNASSSDFTVQTESLNGNKSYSISQSSNLTSSTKNKGVYTIGC